MALFVVSDASGSQQHKGPDCSYGRQCREENSKISCGERGKVAKEWAAPVRLVQRPLVFRLEHTGRKSQGELHVLATSRTQKVS